MDDGTVLMPPMFEEIVASYYKQEGYFPKGVSARYMSLVFKEGDKYGLASACAYPRGREDKIILISPIYDEIVQIPWASSCYMVRQGIQWAIYTLIRERYSDDRECVFHTVTEFCPFEIKEFVGSISLGSGEDDYIYAIWGLKSSWGYWGAFMTEPTMYIPPLFDHLSFDGEEDDEYIVG